MVPVSRPVKTLSKDLSAAIKFAACFFVVIGIAIGVGLLTLFNSFQ